MRALTTLQNDVECEILHLERKDDGILTLTLRGNDIARLLGGDHAPDRPFRLLARPQSDPDHEQVKSTNSLLRSELQRTIAYIQDNLESSLSLQEIADAAGLSPHYIARLFKQSTGQTL